MSQRILGYGHQTTFSATNLTPAGERNFVGLFPRDVSIDSAALIAGNVDHTNRAGTPRDLTEIFQKLGGRQHDVRVRAGSFDDSHILAPISLGRFSYPEIGSGTVRFGRAHPSDGDYVNVVFDLDNDSEAVMQKVTNATIFIGAKGFRPEAGSATGLSEKVEVPLAWTHSPRTPVYDRGGRVIDHIPEKNLIGVSIDAADLRDMAARLGETNSLDFYGRLELKGRDEPLYINLDSAPRKNFSIKVQDLAAPGPV